MLHTAYMHHMHEHQFTSISQSMGLHHCCLQQHMNIHANTKTWNILAESCAQSMWLTTQNEIDWLTVWLIDWLIERMLDWLIDWLIELGWTPITNLGIYVNVLFVRCCPYGQKMPCVMNLLSITPKWCYHDYHVVQNATTSALKK